MSTSPFPPPAWRPCLTAILVNYNSGAMAQACLRSLQREWARCEGPFEELEILVVDNASPLDQQGWLDSMAREGARILHAPGNLGYAGAVQHALVASRFEGPVLFLNPDLFFLPGSLESLLRHLDCKRSIGAVAPGCFVDEDCALHLPPSPLPSAWGELLSCVGRLVPALARRLARDQSAAARDFWSADRPRPLSMLSGACVLVPAQIARGPEPLLDPRYPLYYEDADLCRRLHRRGLTLEWVPGARVVHHWSRSAGSGAAFEGEPRRRWTLSRRSYFRRWSSAPARWLLAAVESLVPLLPAAWLDRGTQPCTPLHPDSDPGADRWTEPVQLTLPAAGPLFMELSMTPNFSLCAGIAVAAGEPGDAWSFPPAAWDWLFEGRYYLRAVGAQAGQVHAAWTFIKSRPARQEPIPILPPIRSHSARRSA